MAESMSASSARFWKEWSERKSDPNVVRVNGHHYYIADEASTSYFRGFGGARWTIRFNDGREVVSTNLWHQGDIPEALRSELPDNAVFLELPDNAVFLEP